MENDALPATLQKWQDFKHLFQYYYKNRFWASLVNSLPGHVCTTPLPFRTIYRNLLGIEQKRGFDFPALQLSQKHILRSSFDLYRAFKCCKI